ncbi:hypothetical protein N0V88_000411 [Collariella sp. IMI 366227]|nr:hypothetical protein N0V88_000411 [Collariella sp. IMI 366227]
MPALDVDAQFKFLLCCIKHSSAGKVNFDNVAEELKIVSKAAAAKRYERLLKAHGITPSAAPRKSAVAAADADDDDNGEGPSAPANKKRKRAAPAKKKAPVKKEKDIKQEDSDDDTEVKEEGSCNPPCQAENTVVPEAFSPLPDQDQNGCQPGDSQENDDYCVVIGERPVSVPHQRQQ